MFTHSFFPALIALLALPARAKVISCTETAPGRGSCLVADRNITWPGSDGSDWWSLDGSGAVEWWWDDKSKDLPIWFFLTPVTEPPRDVEDHRWRLNNDHWWLLDTGAMSSAGRHVFSPIQYAIPGHDIAAEHNYTSGKYRLEIGSGVWWPSLRDCSTIEGALAEARGGNNTPQFRPECKVQPQQVWPAYIELKLKGPDMPQVAELKAGKSVNASGAGLAASVSWLAAAVLAVAAVAVLG